MAAGRSGDSGMPDRKGSGGRDGTLAPPLDLYRLLVESVRDYAIFGLDPTGHIISWNRGAQRFKGYTADEIIGKHFSIFYPPEDQGIPPMELEVAAREGRFEDEGWRVRKDGTRFWANVVITALRDSTGALVGFAKVTRDLTERRESEQRAIADARRVAASEASNRAKGEFLAAMSHELRTPLNAIGGYADLLAMGIAGKLSETQLQYIDRIRSSQHHLLAVINDLLNYSRLESGQVTYDIEPVPIRQAIATVIPMVETQAAAKRLRIEHAQDVVSVALADRPKVEQILVNLLSNAVKFTAPEGRIAVIVGESDGAISIAVRDTGIGIPADKLDSIFEPFVQVGRSLASPHEGTGLGLAISRDLARAMSGELRVESELGVGTTFTLTLPAAPGDHGD